MNNKIEELVNSFSESFLAAKELKESFLTEKQNLLLAQDEIKRLTKEFSSFIEDAKESVQKAKTEAQSLLEDIREMRAVEERLKGSNENSINILTRETAARFEELERKISNFIIVGNNVNNTNNSLADNELEKYLPVKGSSYRITIREGKEYVELSFSGNPGDIVRKYLKDNYFGWSNADKVWRANTKHLDVAKKIVGEE